MLTTSPHAHILDTYRYNRVTYYVDYRMQQFRSNQPLIQFIDFKSDKGDRILSKMIRENVADLSRINL